MKRTQIDLIARLITEDPDLFCEEASAPLMPGTTPGSVIDTNNKPLSALEISQQATEQAGMPDASSQVADQLKKQQDMERQQQQEKQRILEPQLQDLQQSMEKLNTGVMQGQQAVASGGEQFSDLDQEMAKINTLVGNFQKQL